MKYLESLYNKCHTKLLKLVYCRHQYDVIWLSYAVIFCYGREKTYCILYVNALLSGARIDFTLSLFWPQGKMVLTLVHGLRSTWLTISSINNVLLQMRWMYSGFVFFCYCCKFVSFFRCFFLSLFLSFFVFFFFFTFLVSSFFYFFVSLPFSADLFIPSFICWNTNSIHKHYLYQFNIKTSHSSDNSLSR